MNTDYFRGDVLLLTDGREVVVTDIPEFDSDLLLVEDGTDVKVINTFQVDKVLSEA